MKLEIVPAYDRREEISALFSAYTDMLIAGDSSFRHYLDLQHYEQEVENLEGKYGRPEGRLYLAVCDGEAAGCIGLRKIDAQNCEMKRLYVKPEFRGKRIGERLVEQLIRDAREIGYAHMLLDTLPFLERAIRLYEKVGFYKIACYNDNPIDNSVFMQLDLQGAAE